MSEIINQGFEDLIIDSEAFSLSDESHLVEIAKINLGELSAAKSNDEGLAQAGEIDSIESEENSQYEIPGAIHDIVTGLGLKVDFTKIPDKLEFKIGEVADLLGLKTYVLRFWETEFDALKPIKSKNNQRAYRRKDVETAFLIKSLLYDERYSIEGARAALRRAKSQVKQSEHLIEMAGKQDHAVTCLQRLVAEIQAFRNHLEKRYPK